MTLGAMCGSHPASTHTMMLMSKAADAQAHHHTTRDGTDKSLVRCRQRLQRPSVRPMVRPVTLSLWYMVLGRRCEVRYIAVRRISRSISEDRGQSAPPPRIVGDKRKCVREFKN